MSLQNKGSIVSLTGFREPHPRLLQSGGIHEAQAYANAQKHMLYEARAGNGTEIISDTPKLDSVTLCSKG